MFPPYSYMLSWPPHSHSVSVLYSPTEPDPYVDNSCEEGGASHFTYLRCLPQHRMRSHCNNPIYLYKNVCM